MEIGSSFLTGGYFKGNNSLPQAVKSKSFSLKVVRIYEMIQILSY